MPDGEPDNRSAQHSHHQIRKDEPQRFTVGCAEQLVPDNREVDTNQAGEDEKQNEIPVCV